MNERELVQIVVGAAYEVSNTLGCGFLEVVYHRALVRELSLLQVPIKAEVPYDVCYKGERIARYLADIIVDDQLIVELKCAEQLTSQHLAQCLNYLKVSGLKTALLVNFQNPKVEWRKVVSRF